MTPPDRISTRLYGESQTHFCVILAHVRKLRGPAAGVSDALRFALEAAAETICRPTRSEHSERAQ